MDERTIDRTQSWISDTQAMALYSTLLRSHHAYLETEVAQGGA